jgi:type III secretory pathway component EscV
MSPVISFAAAAVAGILLYGRIRRLATRPQRSHWGDPRSRALAEALVSALTVLLVGKILAVAMNPAPGYTLLVFTTLALATAVSQFLKSLRAPRALITVRR